MDARGAGTQIKLNVSTQQQLFNSMDPAPFRERDLDSAVVAYIVESTEDLPSREPLALAVTVTAERVGAEAAEVLREAIHQSFRRRAGSERRQLKHLFRTGRISLVIGVAFVAAATVVGETLAEMVSTSRYSSIVHESIVIGGWVALWYPINLFLYDWWPIWRRARLYDRLAAIAVEVIPARPEPIGVRPG